MAQQIMAYIQMSEIGKHQFGDHFGALLLVVYENAGLSFQS